MNGMGFLWKGMADRVGAFGDQKLKDDESARDRNFKREQAGWDALSSSFVSGQDRKSREGIAADNQRGMNYSAIANSHRQMAGQFLTAISDLKYSGNGPEVQAKVRQLQALADSEMAKAEHIEQTKMNVVPMAPMKKSGGGIIAKIRAAAMGGK